MWKLILSQRQPQTTGSIVMIMRTSQWCWSKEFFFLSHNTEDISIWLSGLTVRFQQHWREPSTARKKDCHPQIRFRLTTQFTFRHREFTWPRTNRARMQTSSSKTIASRNHLFAVG